MKFPEIEDVDPGWASKMAHVAGLRHQLDELGARVPKLVKHGHDVGTFQEWSPNYVHRNPDKAPVSKREAAARERPDEHASAPAEEP